MCFIYTCNFLTLNGYCSVDKLKYGETLVDLIGNTYTINNIYRLNEYKIVKMVRILPKSIDGTIPLKTTYLKPTQYLKYNGNIITANQLVKLRLAEYEKLNILNFYLLSVEAKSIDSINEFVLCNGLEVSVYNKKHPLNNRFNKYSLEEKK